MADQSLGIDLSSNTAIISRFQFKTGHRDQSMFSKFEDQYLICNLGTGKVFGMQNEKKKFHVLPLFPISFILHSTSKVFKSQNVENTLLKLRLKFGMY